MQGTTELVIACFVLLALLAGRQLLLDELFRRALRQPRLWRWYTWVRSYGGLDRSPPVHTTASELNVPFYEHARRNCERVQDKFVRPPASGGCTVKQLHIGLARLPVRIIRPPSLATSMLVWFHGGGWCVGSTAAYESTYRHLAATTGVVVVAVDYRLAPEAPYPAAVEDAVFALRWLMDNGEAFDLPTHSVFVGGESAGGNLAAAACLKQAQDGRSGRLRGCLLVYPPLLMGAQTQSAKTVVADYPTTAASIARSWQAYTAACTASAAELEADFLLSPLLAPPRLLADMPATLMVTAEHDPLRDECIAFKDALQEADVAVSYCHFARAMHGFFNWPGLAPQALACYSRFADFMSEHGAAVDGD